MTKVMITIEASASAFIVPNHASLASGYLNPEEMEQRAQAICDLNNVQYDPENDHIVQVWIHSKEDLETENLEDQGGKVMINNEVVRIHSRCGLIPERLLRGHKEGDVVDIKFMANDEITRNDPDAHSETFILHLHLKLEQRGYRYSRFGDFQKVLALVTE